MKFERGIIKDANNILRHYGAVYIRYNKEKDEFSCADLAEGYIYADGKREHNIPNGGESLKMIIELMSKKVGE